MGGMAAKLEPFCWIFMRLVGTDGQLNASRSLPGIHFLKLVHCLSLGECGDHLGLNLLIPSESYPDANFPEAKN